MMVVIVGRRSSTQDFKTDVAYLARLEGTMDRYKAQRLKKHRFRRDKTEVSCCMKYLMFGFNVLFWLVGAGLCAIGLWAWTEKDMFNNIGKVTSMTLDPALAFIVTGGVMFIIGFCGCIGALRENTVLLLIFSVLVGLIFAAELLFGILAFAYKDWIKNQIESQVQNMIINYREDSDLENLIDWVQQDWLKCCGVKSYADWELNRYFNCSSKGSIDACGVPFSCCKPTGDVIKNRHCGFGMIINTDRETKIYTEGCIPSGEKWLETNLIPVASVAVGIAVLQILGICFASILRCDVKAQKAKWGYDE
ncbi:tetraspanin-5-like isoform X2 [Ostrea edulis]|uniref:tetraspanin-5-like isoform X2 n=2 Tax=Ostrea edulis TaxID=37623 RepID=UPI0024AEFF9C|nr:tetraspanin-5-like isoform X2 [Ostrea edulis]